MQPYCAQRLIVTTAFLDFDVLAARGMLASLVGTFVRIANATVVRLSVRKDPRIPSLTL
jgi:hypothetical protein